MASTSSRRPLLRKPGMARSSASLRGAARAMAFSRLLVATLPSRPRSRTAFFWRSSWSFMKICRSLRAETTRWAIRC